MKNSSVIKRKIAKILESKLVQRILLVLGILFIVLTGLIAIDPEPFLRLGVLGIFIFNLFGSGLLIVPVLVGHYHPIIIAVASALGVSINDSVSWLIGSYGHRRHKHSATLQKIEDTISRYGLIAIFAWSFIPFPYDLIGFVAGYLGMSYKKYIIATFLGKLIRYALLSYGIQQIFF